MIRGTTAVFIAMFAGVGCGAPAGNGAGGEHRTTEIHRDFDLQGHRGARGLLPENTIPSFKKALELGAQTVELDVVVTADSIVLVSHEPWFSSVICSTPQGDPIEEEEERSFNIFQMTYDQAAAFDCGSRGNRLFETQQPEAAHKPRLDSTIQALERYAGESELPAPRYNVEIKSRPEFDGTFTPNPEAFARLVYEAIEEEGVTARTTIQSFDPRPLQILRQIDSSLRLAFLVDNDVGFSANLERLGFSPAIYSPHQRLVDRSLVDSVHATGMKIIPWTVNDPQSMRRLLDLGVDGLITDYPDRARTLPVTGVSARGPPRESRTPVE